MKNNSIIHTSESLLQELKSKYFEKLISGENYGEIDKYFHEDGMNILKKAFIEVVEEADLNYLNNRENNDACKDKVNKTFYFSFGAVEINRRLYIGATDNYYYIDNLLGMKKYERYSIAAKSNVIESSLDVSYDKSGNRVSEFEKVSASTTMNMLKEIRVFENKKTKIKKKNVDYLYIDADEDHISLQNGDTAIGKLIYTYEGKEKVAPGCNRKRLIEPHYFGRIDIEKHDNIRLWGEVRSYIMSNYNVDKIKEIYLNSDGGGWIKQGLEMFPNITFVMDEFHIKDYIDDITSIVKDSRYDAKLEIMDILENGNADELEIVLSRIASYAETDVEKNKVNKCLPYFFNNMDSIFKRFSKNENILGCSAEGHVSHILSSRLSSRPMGWTIEGANKMIALRLYKANGNDIYDLVKANSNFDNYTHTFENHTDMSTYSSTQMFAMEKATENPTWKYVDRMQATLTIQGRKVLNLNKIL